MEISILKITEGAKNKVSARLVLKLSGSEQQFDTPLESPYEGIEEAIHTTKACGVWGNFQIQGQGGRVAVLIFMLLYLHVFLFFGKCS